MGWIVLTAVMLGIGLVVVGGLGRDLQVVEDALGDTRSSLLAARAALADGDVDATSRALQDARRSSAVSNQRVNRLAWRVAERAPVAGRSLRSVSGMVAVADETARLGRQVVEGARGLIGPDGGVAVQTRDGRVPLEPLRQAAGALQDVDTHRLRELTGDLQAVPASLVPGRVASARVQTISLAVEVADVLDGIRDLLGAVPALLGEDGPRRYFLAMQNPAELRGTGGLIGFFATVDVADGRMELGRPESYEALDGTDQGTAATAAPVSATFADRYGTAGAASFFGNVNVDPDLPTTAPVMMDLYEQRTGQALDGVVVIDPIGLALLLEATGPVDVSDAVAATAPGLPDPISPAQIPSVTMAEVYDVFEGRNQARRDYLREVATTSFDAVFDAQWDGVAMARQVGAAISRGHLAVHTRHEATQEVLARLDAAGALAPPEPERDHFAVTANNLAGNKLDLYMAHQISGSVTLTGGEDLASWGRRLDLRVEMANTFDPADHANYIAGSFPVLAFAEGSPQRGPRGLNRTWFSTWVPGPASMTVDDSSAASWFLHGHQVADRTLEVATDQTRGFEVTAVGSAPVTAVGATRRYVLEYRRQAKAIPDRLDLTVQPPPGWSVEAATVTGGADGAGHGPYGDAGPPLSAAVTDDGSVVLTGDASSDVVLVVDLVPEDGGALGGLLPRR